jgi:hypothetical protein
LNAPTVGFGQVFIPSVDLPFVVFLSSTWLTAEAARLHSCPSPRVQSVALASAARRSPLLARRSARLGPYGRLFHGVLRPFDVLGIRAATDAFASRRGCLPRLRSTFRLSQPLGALLRAYPLRPCFMPVTPMGFHDLQRFPLQGSPASLTNSIQCLPKVTSAICSSRSVRVLLVVAAVVENASADALHTARLRGFEHPWSPFSMDRFYAGPTGRLLS